MPRAESSRHWCSARRAMLKCWTLGPDSYTAAVPRASQNQMPLPQHIWTPGWIKESHGGLKTLPEHLTNLEAAQSSSRRLPEDIHHRTERKDVGAYWIVAPPNTTPYLNHPEKGTATTPCCLEQIQKRRQQFGLKPLETN